jgi:hypothetical protein
MLAITNNQSILQKKKLQALQHIYGTQWQTLQHVSVTRTTTAYCRTLTTHYSMFELKCTFSVNTALSTWMMTHWGESTLYCFTFNIILQHSVAHHLLLNVTDRLSYMQHLLKTLNFLEGCKIWGFYGGEYEECHLLRCYAMWLLK